MEIKFNSETNKVVATVGDEEFPVMDCGKQTTAKIAKAQEQLGKLVEYEAAMEEAKKILKPPAAPKKRKAKEVEPRVGQPSFAYPAMEPEKVPDYIG